jgi:LysR family transcriptional regulator AphB
MLDDLALFVAIVEAGSLNAAADKEGVPAATVTRRLQKLERQLGCKLLHRSARRMLPTAEGMQYYEQCRPLLQALKQSTQTLDATLRDIAGSIRMLAPINLVSAFLTPALVSFIEQYPAVRLELDVSNDLQDMIGTGADLAIRAGPQEDSALTQKRLGDGAVELVAAPSYLARRGHPQNAAELQSHALLVAEPLSRWQLHDPLDDALTIVQPEPRLRVNEMRVAINAAEAGLGILMCPLIQCHEALARGTLVRVLDGWVRLRRPIYAVWSQQHYLPARVRALVDHLAQYCAAHELLAEKQKHRV